MVNQREKDLETVKRAQSLSLPWEIAPEPPKDSQRVEVIDSAGRLVCRADQWHAEFIVSASRLLAEGTSN
jgi:hypothetical protein